MLVVTHAVQQSLHEMDLLRLRPALEVLETDPLLFVDVLRQNDRRRVSLFVNRHTRLTDKLSLQHTKPLVSSTINKLKLLTC